MSLTLKILLLADVFFALLLIAYLVIKYGKVFSKRPEVFRAVKGSKLETEPEVFYEEEKSTLPKQEKKVLENSTIDNKEQEEMTAQKLSIGSFEELENFVSGKSES